jgi:hypothetical protein
MEIFDSINLYLSTHPAMLDQLELLFRIKFWILLVMALYFMTLPYRHARKQQAQLALKEGYFLA